MDAEESKRITASPGSEEIFQEVELENLELEIQSDDLKAKSKLVEN